MSGDFPDWMNEALCAGADPEAWFPVDLRTREQFQSPSHSRAARKICGRCPVNVECLAFAMADPTLQGIWGGLSARERVTARRVAR